MGTLRERLRAATAETPLERPLRRLNRVVSRTAARDHRDGEHLRAVLAGVLRRDADCIDVGAHEGVVLREILRCAPDGRHLAFEPIPLLAQRLAATFPDVEVRAAALSDVAGKAEFAWVQGDPQQSGLRDRGGRGTAIEVDVVRLDDALPVDYAPSLIKIDVEGAEVRLLRGAVQTLSRYQPVVVFEHGIGGADVFGDTSGELWDLLAGAGLRIYDLDGAGPYSRDQFEAVFTEPIWNFLART